MFLQAKIPNFQQYVFYTIIIADSNINDTYFSNCIVIVGMYVVAMETMLLCCCETVNKSHLETFFTNSCWKILSYCTLNYYQNLSFETI